jgi:hypothetical protein
MGVKTTIEAILNVLPLIRRIWHWLLERNLEVTTTPRYEDLPYYVSAPDPIKGLSGYVTATINLTLINHRVDRPERIIECWGELRKRRWIFWNATLAKLSVETNADTDYQLKYPITNLLLEPMGAPHKRPIRLSGELSGFKMPRRSELVLVFKMVGTMRRKEHRLDTVTYNSKVPKADDING